MRNKVVVHYLDGRVIKGVTLDFVPNKQSFHLGDTTDEWKVTEVLSRSLKAVFFVKTFAGDAAHEPPPDCGELQHSAGRKLRVTFHDGEVIVGTSTGYAPGRDGFFLLPADPGGNNERIYIFAHATREVEALKPSVAV